MASIQELINLTNIYQAAVRVCCRLSDMEVDTTVKRLFLGNLHSGMEGDDRGKDNKYMNKVMPESIKHYIKNKTG